MDNSRRQYPLDSQLQQVQSQLRILESFPSSYLISKRQSHFGVVVTVELTAPLLQGLPTQVDSVAFDIHMEGNFPTQAPTVACVSHFTSPTIADGRDLLENVIKGKWTPDTSLYDVVSALQDFVKFCLTEVSPMALSIEIGTFHLGSVMYLSQWSGRETLGYFSCTEVNGKKETQRAVIVTETVILQLEPSVTYIGTGVLMSWATLQSLANIKRSKQNTRRITFDWKAIKDTPAYSQTFLMEDSSACISLITSNMSRLGVLVKRTNAILEGTLREEEVTKRSLKDIHINDVLHAIAVYEANINEKLTLEMVNSLMGLYQKAIEYFSGVGDPRYDEFLDRMHYMLSNDAIQKALSGEEPSPPEEIKLNADSGDLVIETPEIQILPCEEPVPLQQEDARKSGEEAEKQQEMSLELPIPQSESPEEESQSTQEAIVQSEPSKEESQNSPEVVPQSESPKLQEAPPDVSPQSESPELQPSVPPQPEVAKPSDEPPPVAFSN